ncbi:MAG: hypothetical protein U0974_03320 [Gemmatimonadales bacterium]|nr:hypothetical protein [Gemmatimonadales bacterium]MDZ4388745.1 hypothetical protein [Gemmatimonadales bacterium]
MSCGTGDPDIATAPGATLELIASTVLVENDTFLIARPTGFVVSDDPNRFIVADVASSRVLRWAANGAPSGSWGRIGRGPAELSGPGAIVQSGRTLWVLDLGSSSWKQFDRETGAPAVAVVFSGVASNAVPNSTPDTLWFGLRRDTEGTSLGMIVAGVDSVTTGGPLPSIYDSLAASGIGRLTPIVRVRTGNHTLLGFGALNGFYLLDAANSVLDSMSIPSVRRRGASAEVIGSAMGDYLALMNGTSILSFAGPAARPGFAITVHYDPTVSGVDVPRITADLFVSVVDLDARTACVDARIPNTGDGRPVVQSVGDTLFVLRQTLDGTAITTQVDSYLVSTAGCTWLPMTQGPLIGR